MVNEPLLYIREECLLWQIDADELWTTQQICRGHEMFTQAPEKTSAFYWCWYFVGEKLLVSSRHCYSQNPNQEWLRTWRYKPGCVWGAHEPPRLLEPQLDGQWLDLGVANPFSHSETENAGLIFQHFAYLTNAQLQFKESYYGYKGAIKNWKKLQNQEIFPVRLKNFFSWVQDSTMVDTVDSLGIQPIMQAVGDDSEKGWIFSRDTQDISSESIQAQPRIVIDGVFFQLYNTGIARLWASLFQEWSSQEFGRYLLILDRNNSAPDFPGISYRSWIPYEYSLAEKDREALQHICNQEGADLFISTYYTTPTETPSVFMGYDMIPEAMGWDLSKPMWREKHRAIQQASSFISISENTAVDLQKFFPDIDPNKIAVAPCGISNSFKPAETSEVNNFKTKYGIVKPYFMLVGAGGGPQSYKNAKLFFDAFASLSSKLGFEVICTGATAIDEAFREATLGTQVHSMRLSDDELRIAYSGAIALVYPSKYEGFGLPLVEAMACGCPIITTPNASIPEVAGDAALYVNDSSVSEMANALCDVQKTSVRESLIRLGLEQVKKFSWAEMAKTVQDILLVETLPFELSSHTYLVFPDWSTDEDTYGEAIQEIVGTLCQSSKAGEILLLLENSGIEDEEMELLLSSIAMNLLMMADINIEDGPNIAVTGQLAPLQWSTLFEKASGRISIDSENTVRIEQVGGQSLATYRLDQLS